jgi:hypothetical protein
MMMVVVLACVSMAAPAEAQLNTQHIKGTVGLKSGSQAPAGVYFIAPLFYVYKADEVKDRNGDRLGLGDADFTSRIYGAASTSSRKGNCSAASTASRSCFRLARTIGFKAPRSMPIQARV